MIASNPEYPGYLNRIETLMTNATYPLSTQGYSPPNFCTQDKECDTLDCEKETTFSYSQCVGTECDENSQCDTDRCDSGMCIPKFGSCMECDEDSDCASGSCYLFRCANTNNLMDDECRCGINSDCQSGRCEGLLSPICEATLAIGNTCDENSDCMSGYCTWALQCGERSFFSNFLTVIIMIAVIAIAYGIYHFKKRGSSGYQEIKTDIVV